MSDERHNANIQDLLNRVREVAGERCTSWFFIGSVKDADGEQTTPSTWGGDFNAVRGMITRGGDRMAHHSHNADFPPDPEPPLDGDDWKAPTP